MEFIVKLNEYPTKLTVIADRYETLQSWINFYNIGDSNPILTFRSSIVDHVAEKKTYDKLNIEPTITIKYKAAPAPIMESKINE